MMKTYKRDTVKPHTVDEAIGFWLVVLKLLALLIGGHNAAIYWRCLGMFAVFFLVLEFK